MQEKENDNTLRKRIRRNICFRIFTNKYLIVTVVFLVIGFLDPNGIISLLRNRNEIAFQEASIRKYRRDIDEIGERIEGMSTKRDSVEKFAREEYYYHSEDEDIFIMK